MNGVMPKSMSSGEMVKIHQIHLNLLLLLISGCCSLHITNMTAPIIQDPREDMLLSCSFYIGQEELYAVKWYKDDYEFFRFSPKGTEQLVEFTVKGVHVDLLRTQCTMSSCSLVLKELSRTFSSGAYRCEVSIEAPTFRLASHTRNVTVAVIPQEKPLIDNLNDTYLVGDLFAGTCLSALGDPSPTITWYLNDEEVNPKFYRSSTLYQNDGKVRLKKASSHLRYHLDRKLLGNETHVYVGVTCEQSTIISTSQNTTKIIKVITEEELLNNQKFFDIFGSTSTVYRGSLTTIIIAMVFVYK